MTGGAFERPGDDAANAMLAVEKFSGDSAHPIKLGHGYDAFMCGDLENAVAGGVHDGHAGADVLCAEFFQDFGAGGGFVAQRFAADLLFERFDNFWREAVLVNWKSLIEPDACHLPVACGGVFAWGVSSPFTV